MIKVELDRGVCRITTSPKAREIARSIAGTLSGSARVVGLVSIKESEAQAISALIVTKGNWLFTARDGKWEKVPAELEKAWEEHVADRQKRLLRRK